MPDSQPNYLTTDTDGRIGAEFAGHIAAAGVDLPPDPTGSFNTDRDSSISWESTANGLVAKIGSYQRNLGIDGGALVMSALKSNDFPNETRITLFDDNTISGTRVVQAQAGVWSKAIINGNEQSNFAQVRGALQKLEVEWTGAVLNFYVNGVLVRSL